MVSFYTERTAEYSLVPAFSKILRSLGKVAPIFFGKHEKEMQYQALYMVMMK